MKRYHAFAILTAAALALMPAAASAQSVTIKIGTVDMKRVFESYYKTKDAEAKINEARNNAKKELEDRMAQAKKLLEDVKKLDEDIAKPELSREAKEGKMKSRGEMAGTLQTMDREIREFQASREKQLQEQSVRMRGGIVEEINKIVSDRVKSDQYDLVLDKSGPSLNGVPVILFARDNYDFTDDVITTLNKNRTSEAATPEAPKAAATVKPKAK